MALTLQTWQAVVSKKWQKTSHFSTLDTAVKAYIGNKSSQNLTSMRQAWTTWIAKFPSSNYKQSDRWVQGGALDDVAALVKVTQAAVQVPQLSMGNLAQQASVAHQQREARVLTQYVTKQIEQTYAGASRPTKWWVKFTFEDRATTIIAKPVICCRAKPNDPNGYQPNDNDLKRWSQQIQGAWKAKFQIGQTTKDVVFDIEFKTWDATTGDENYKINVVNISVERAQEEILGLPQGTLQAQDWRTKQRAREEILDGTSMGTPHLSQWGAQDMQAIVHEFGHAIGNPDEYDVVSHNVDFGGHEGLDYNKPGFTTDSIMNDTKRGLVRKRHFAIVAKLYHDWKVRLGQPAPNIVVIDPKA